MFDCRYSDAGLADVWRGEGGEVTKRLLMGGAMGVGEVMEKVKSEAKAVVGGDGDDEYSAAAAAASAAAAAGTVTVGQFLDWLMEAAAAAKGGVYGGDASTDGSVPSSPDR